MEIDSHTMELLSQIRKKSPLIHNITNQVVMNVNANILLAIGASPVMAHSLQEVEEMSAISSALVLNIGTLDEKLIQSMILAGKTANEKNIPVILDPVGAGATQFRTNSAKKILSQVDVSVVRGNASEIFSLYSDLFKTKGVDSSIDSETFADEIIELAKKIKDETGAVTAVSGKEDIISNGKSTIKVKNGHEILTKITGIGCGLSAVCGAFASVSDNNLLESIASAFIYYGACAEITSEETILPGSFAVKFLDTLYSAPPEKIKELANAEVIKN